MEKRKKRKFAAWFLTGLFALALVGQALLPLGEENLQALTAQLAPAGGTTVYATEVREPETYAARVTELVQTASAKEQHRFVTITVRADDLTLQKDGAAAPAPPCPSPPARAIPLWAGTRTASAPRRSVACSPGTPAKRPCTPSGKNKKRGQRAVLFFVHLRRVLAIRPGVRYNREKCVKECLE